MNEERVKEITQEWLLSKPNIERVKEEQIIIEGGLVTDLMGVTPSGEIAHIVECKGSTNIGNIAKGIGQTYQYEHQKSSNPRTQNAQVLLVVPKEVQRHFETLTIPEPIDVYLVKEDGSVFERRPQRGSSRVELQLPGTFYIRDVKFSHLKKIIQIIYELSKEEDDKLLVKDIKSEVSSQEIDIPADGYNHLITLRRLGLINSKNKLSPKGYHVLGLIEESEIAYRREMCKLFYSFLINVLNAMIIISRQNNQTLDSIKCSHQEIADKICEEWGDKVRFLYDPRTISTVIRELIELGVLEKDSGEYKIKRLIHPKYLPFGPKKGLKKYI